MKKMFLGAARTSACRVAVVAALGLTVAGCSDDKPQSTTSVTPNTAKAQVDLPMASFTSVAQLNALLPKDTLSYMRIPSLWLLFSSQENGLRYALGNKAHVDEMNKIREALNTNILSKMSKDVRGLAQLLAYYINAPLEIAVIPAGNGHPMPTTIIGTALNIKTAKELDQLVEKELAVIPGLQKTGERQFTMSNIVGLYQFDAKTGRLTIAFGADRDAAYLEKQLSQLKKSADNPIAATEQQIDTSDKGFFSWVNTKAVLPMAMMFAPGSLGNDLKMAGVDKINGIALGYGVSDNKTRLKLVVDVEPDTGMHQFIPVANNQFDLKAVGKPRTVAMMSIPSSSDIQKIVAASEKLSPGATQSFDKANQEMLEETGASIEEFADLLGSSAVYFSDDIGSFFTHKVTDPVLAAKLVKKASEQEGAAYSTYNKEGVEIHYLKMPSLYWKGIQKVPEFAFVQSLHGRYYWVEEDGYMIYASSPQLLIERARRKASYSLAGWLKESQGIDSKHSLLMLTTSVKDLSRKSYHNYLAALPYLADVVGADIDPFAFPSADQLGFADYGSVGLAINNSKQFMSVELNFENGTSDIFYSSGQSAALMIGVLSAIALPAYQDYSVRAKVSTGMIDVRVLQNTIADLLLSDVPINEITNGAHGIGTAESYAGDTISRVVVESGVITAYFHEVGQYSAYGDEQTIIYEITDSSNPYYWDCYKGTLPSKYRPASCR